MTGTMKAVAKLGPRPGAEIIEVPIPNPGPSEVLVKSKGDHNLEPSAYLQLGPVGPVSHQAAPCFRA